MKQVKIDEEIVQRTTQCEHDFSCISEDKTCICEAIRSIGHVILEIKHKYRSVCRYCLSYGNTDICLCPIRNEIYNRYNI